LAFPSLRFRRVRVLLQEGSMAEEPTDNEHERDTSSYVGLGLSLGAGLGAAFGAALGAATDNMGFWVGIGISMGTAMGLALGAGLSQKDKNSTEE
jgi:hypothetical protein